MYELPIHQGMDGYVVYIFFYISCTVESVLFICIIFHIFRLLNMFKAWWLSWSVYFLLNLVSIRWPSSHVMLSIVYVASSSVACKHEELDGLYSGMNKMILEGLQSYDKWDKYRTMELKILDHKIVWFKLSFKDVVISNYMADYTTQVQHCCTVITTELSVNTKGSLC